MEAAARQARSSAKKATVAESLVLTASKLMRQKTLVSGARPGTLTITEQLPSHVRIS